MGDRGQALDAADRRRIMRWRRRTQTALDVVAWFLALALAATLRLDLDPSKVEWAGLLVLLPVVGAAQAVAGHASGLYRGRWVFGSFEEVAALARTVGIAGVVLLAVDLPFTAHRPIPISAVIGGSMIAFLVMGGVRYTWRLALDARDRRRAAPHRQRAIVFGAGDGGRRAVRAMVCDPQSQYLPVAFLDDDPELANLSYMGVRVVGDRARLEDVARTMSATCIVVAVPSADASLVRDLIDRAVPAGLDVRVLPSVRELLDDEVRVVDIRRPTEVDLLGRHQVETDIDEIAGYITGRRVAVTGAGGSIGAELCRQIAALQPAELIMIDRDESALHGVQLSLEGRALLDSRNLVLLDIRDRAGVARVFLDRRPEVVFHAAALKHLPLLEKHPIEALKTNVWGTLAVLEAAAAAGVPTVVNISTDKAANPASVLGFSKRICEGLTAWAAREYPGRFISVRFGNVLGSRGSVLTAFHQQLEAGGSLTVTHPDVTRFFMTVEEAVQLVVQAGAIGRGGEVMVLDMGEPVRIADVARQLAQTTSPPCPIEFVGLRPGEKLHEQLFGDGEDCTPSEHPLIRCVEVPPLDPDQVRDIDPHQADTAVASLMAELCLGMSVDLVTAPIESLSGD
jgi:FlaA1/EpsC-like NDP-sugar epimerase